MTHLTLLRSQLISFCLLSFLLVSCKAQQQITGEKETEISLDITEDIEIVEADKLGNIYIVNSKNEFKMYDTNLSPAYRYYDNSLGKIHFVDVRNPLKIITYQRDYGSVKFFDNTLSSFASLNLYDLGYDDIPAICLSNDNHIWLYDAANFKLVKVDDKGQKITVSNSMVSYNLADIQPVSMSEQSNTVLVNDPEKGIFLFDNYGQYLKSIPILNAERIRYDGKVLIYNRGEQLYTYSMLFFEERKLDPEISKTNNSKKQIREIILVDEFWIYVYDEGLKRVKR